MGLERGYIVDTREGFGWKIMDFWLQPLLCPSANPLDVKL